MATVLADGDLPRERARDFAFLRLCDGDRRHPGEAAAVFCLVPSHLAPDNPAPVSSSR